MRPFINQYDRKEIDFPPKQEKDWKNFESNNTTAIHLKVCL